MDFSAREMKLIERLRKEERRWRWSRWILLGTAAFIIVIYGYVASMLCDRVLQNFGTDQFSTNLGLLIFAMFWPKVIVMTGLAGVLIGVAIRDWRGNVTRMLLLKLLDSQEKQTSKDEKST